MINFLCICSIGTDQVLKLIPNNSSIDLSSKSTVFTVFAPVDDSFKYLTLNAINYINQNLSYIQRMEVRYILKSMYYTEAHVIHN